MYQNLFKITYIPNFKYIKISKLKNFQSTNFILKIFKFYQYFKTKDPLILKIGNASSPYLKFISTYILKDSSKVFGDIKHNVSKSN